MSSLKSTLPHLAPLLETTPDALYERQRALVRYGILKPIAGRGPGSGVEFSANSAATLLIAVAAVNSLSEVDGRIVEFCEAVPIYISKTCPFTGQKTFVGALQAIFEKGYLMSRVRRVSIDQNTSRIVIEYVGRNGRTILHSNFTRGEEPQVKFITKTAVIETFVLKAIYELVNREIINARIMVRSRARAKARAETANAAKSRSVET